jgi:hypothetical protein
MANEFISRNGIIALNNSVISGSLTVTGGIIGSFQGTASFATTASNVLGGASNYIPLWNGATTLSSSVLYQSSGNIGIGTTSPLSKLHISGPSNDVGVRMLNTTAAKAFVTYVDVSGNYIIYDANVDNNRLTITSAGTASFSGNVGIGTTSPASTLDVRGVVEAGTGTIRTVLSYTGTGGVVGTLSNHPLILYANNDERARITAAGNLGIGTTTPGYKLDVNSQSTGIAASFGAQISNTNFSGISFGYVEAANTSYRKSALVFERSETHGGGSNASGKIHFLLNNNGASSATALTDAVVTIDSVGTTVGSVRIGIGTRFPTASLHISGSVSTDNLMRVQSSTGAEYFFISGSGNVGIGTTTPVDKLEVEGNIRIRTGNSLTLRNATNDSTAAIYNAGGSAASNIYLAVGPSPTMTIGSNVGIGTTSPSTKLHVVGQTYITDDLLIRGTHNPYAFGGRGVIALNGTGGNIISFASATTTHGYMFVTNTNYEFVTVANQNFLFYNGSTEALRINNSGNVGIGTSSPSTRLHVSASTGGVLEVDGAGTAGANALYVSASGNVGIGTSTPTEKLTIRGNGAKLLIESETSPTN